MRQFKNILFTVDAQNMQMTFWATTSYQFNRGS